MLPFIKKSKEASVAVPSQSVERKPDDESEEAFDSLEMVAQDLIDAMQSKDAKLLALALRSAFQICDLEPHEEGEHV